MANETEQKKKTRPVSGGTTKELVVSIFAGLVSGFVVITQSIQSEFSDLIKNWPGMVDILDDNGIVKEEGLIPKLQKDSTILDLEYRDKNNLLGHTKAKTALKKQHTGAVKKLLERWGIVTDGGPIDFVKGTHQRYGHIGDETKKHAIWYKGATLAIVVGVGMYNLLTSIATRKKTREIEDLILDKVLEEPTQKLEAAHRALHAEPNTKVSQVERHERVHAAKDPEVAVRA